MHIRRRKCSGSSTATWRPTSRNTARAPGPGCRSRAAPLCLATEGKGMAIETLCAGAQRSRSFWTDRPATSEITSWSGRKAKSRSTISACFGSTETRTQSASSTTSRLLEATRTILGNSDRKAAALAVPRGDSTTARRPFGGVSGPDLQRPRTTAEPIVPTPTTPTMGGTASAMVASELKVPSYMNVTFCSRDG